MSAAPKVLVMLGTRPDAIKLAPVIRELRRPSAGLRIEVCATGQHRALLDQMLAVFRIEPDHDLDLMRKSQPPYRLLERAMGKLRPLIRKSAPDLLIVQGDTATALAGAMAAVFNRVPAAHVEAGLRSGDLSNPYPEEMYRILTDRAASLWFPPTGRAARNLRAEGLGKKNLLVTGNTVVDALKAAAPFARKFRSPALRRLPRGKKIILVTLHRRESFGAPLDGVFQALLELARRNEDAAVVYTVHPNPRVHDRAHRVLRHPRIHLCPPADYLDFLRLMSKAHFLVTDSGGLQEEAPTFHKPVLVAREVTERPELLQAGGGRLVGTDPARIVREAGKLLNDRVHYRRMASAPNPFGDGRAARRIRSAIRHFFGLGPAPRPWRLRRRLPG